MIIESLYYLEPSKLTSAIILQPEIKQSKTYFEAELIDPTLIIESFYRLHRILKIRKGRQALTEHLILYFDPFITIQAETVNFEVFSYDCTHYAKLELEADAFKNIKEWKEGVTNVDFTPEFIKQIRSAKGSERNVIKVDPKGFEVEFDESSVFEKKIEMPDNWKIAFENIRKYSNQEENIKELENPLDYVKTTPFGPFLKEFAKVGEGWTLSEGWRFAELKLRKGLGALIVGSTESETQRFDGRENPRYAAVRDFRMLRSLKSYLLTVTPLTGLTWEVKGSKTKHIVHKKGRSYHCDCGDAIYGGSYCKHIRAIVKPKNRVLSKEGDKWTVITKLSNSIEKNDVVLENSKFTCTCWEYRKLNICHHIISILEKEEDFQFEELLEDLT